MATAEHPNVLLVMSDEHAPQYSSVYGHPLVVRASFGVRHKFFAQRTEFRSVRDEVVTRKSHRLATC